MNARIALTTALALLGGILLQPFLGLFAGIVGFSIAYKSYLFLLLLVYAALLAAWSGTPMRRLFFPLALAGAAILWPGRPFGFYVLALAMLAWIRSGICASGPISQRLWAELITSGGGIFLIAILGSGSMAGRALSLSLFLLIQTLYFYIAPQEERRNSGKTKSDTFENARKKAENLMKDLLAEKSW